MFDLSRQIALIGESNQHKLSKAKIAIIGIGALGTVVSELLVRLGIKDLTLVDRDVVEESNLQRQFLYTNEDLDKSKVAAAKLALTKINPLIEIKAEAVHLSSNNIGLLKNNDIIIDCSDNLKTRFLINDFCKKNKLPWIYGAAIKTSGYAMLIMPSGPCLSCFLNEASLETCSTAGILNTNITTIASLQVNLALKYLINKKISLELFYLDLWTFKIKKLIIKKRKECSTCNGDYKYLNSKERVDPVTFCSEKRYQVAGKPQDLKKLQNKLKKGVFDGFTLNMGEIILFKDGRALIKAKTKSEAEGIYSKHIGN